MARIRTVKPELYKHEDLFDLEKRTGLPLRLSWIGLFAVCDREGRFKLRPRAIKTEVMPYDDIDFSLILFELAKKGFIIVYENQGEHFAYIPSFHKHQVINAREKASTLPSPQDATSTIINDFEEIFTREARVGDACTVMHVRARGEGKGREGNMEGKGVTKRLPVPDGPGTELNSLTWTAYSKAYELRYKAKPVRNAKANSLVKQIVQRLGEEAPEVVEFYLTHNKTYYVSKLHDLGLCLADAEALRTQWFHGRAVTNADIKNFERQVERDNLNDLIERGEI